MDKLIELLNEYIPEGWSIEHGGKSVFYEGLRYNDRIISKDFGFIKRLVDNDKITSDGIKPRDKLVKEITILDQNGHAIGWDNKYTEEEQLLMYLAIQDSPIEFLISILK